VIITTLHLGLATLSTNVFANDVKPNLNAGVPTVKILAYGDSLTAGYRLPPADSYPKQLEVLLNNAKASKVEITNGGVSGDTSAQALARLEWSLKKGPFDYALLCVGANDGLRQLAVPELEANLRKMLKTLKERKVKVILLGMQLPTNFAPAYRKAFGATYPKLAKEFGVPLYPFLLEGITQNPKLNLSDTIHPNKEGYALIAQKLESFLAPILKR